MTAWWALRPADSGAPGLGQVGFPAQQCSQAPMVFPEYTKAKASSRPKSHPCAVITPSPAQPTLEWALK